MKRTLNKKALYIIISIMLLACMFPGLSASAEESSGGYLFELTGDEVGNFLEQLENTDESTEWNTRAIGHAYLRPSFRKSSTEYSQAPGGGITVSNRSKYWHGLDIRQEWMEPDYSYVVEVDFVSDVPVTFAVTGVTRTDDAEDLKVYELTHEDTTSATLVFEMDNDSRTYGQRGVRLVTLGEESVDASYTITGIRIHHGEIFIFPRWIVYTVLAVLLVALAVFVTYRAMTDERFKQRLPDRTFVVCNTIFMLFILVIMLYPFLNILAISFNDPQDSIKGNIYLWPRIFTVENYEQVFKNPNLITAFINSVMRTVLATVGGVIVCSMSAYVLSRKEFMWNKFVSIYFLLTMYVSAGLIPTFFLFTDLGLVGNFHVYWVPGLFGAFNVIVIRTFMQGLPDSLVEAGRLDGAGEFRIFAQIIFPLCKPVLATVGLWMAVGNWNDWFTSFVYAPFRDELTTLQWELFKELSNTIAMMGQQSSEAFALQGNVADIAKVTPVAIRSAITIVATVPILCVYPFLQKYFVKGVHVGSVKG